jgi:DNA-binding IclR family transcriptional regulator
MDSSAGKALILLDAFAGTRSTLGVTELAKRTNLPKSTAHRLLTVLIDHGYVKRVEERYCLTEHVFEIGNQTRFSRPTGIRQRAMPFLAELFAETRQTIHLAVLSGTDVLYLEKIFGNSPPHSGTTVGMRLPTYSTALGKAMVAFSDDDTIQRNLAIDFRRFTPHTIATAAQLEKTLAATAGSGFALDHEETTRGVSCIAAPIFDPGSRKAIAAISICSISSRNIEARFSRTLLGATTALSNGSVTYI